MGYSPWGHKSWTRLSHTHTHTHTHTPGGGTLPSEGRAGDLSIGATQRDRERRPLNRGASSPLLPLPWPQHTQTQARLFSAHYTSAWPSELPLITCQERVGPLVTHQERVGAPSHRPGEGGPQSPTRRGRGPSPRCFFPGSPPPPRPLRWSPGPHLLAFRLLSRASRSLSRLIFLQHWEQ